MLRLPTVSGQGGVDLQIGPEWVPAVKGLAGAVDARLVSVFVFERTEQAVPHDQNTAVIFVQVPVIHRMVDPMVGRTAEPAVKPAQATDLLCVHPELVEQIDHGHHTEYQRRHAQHGHGQVKHPTKQGATAGLAKCGGEVVVLALVMHYVCGPQYGHLMAHAVQPVVAKVVQQQSEHPAGPGEPKCAGCVLRQDADGLVGRYVDANTQQSREDGRDLAEHPQAKAIDSVARSIGVAARPFLLSVSAQQIFHDDHGKKNRGGKDDDLTRAHLAIVAEVFGQPLYLYLICVGFRTAQSPPCA